MESDSTPIKERKRRRTKEEKDITIQQLDKLTKKHKILLRRVLTNKVEEWTEEEIEKQEQELIFHNRKKPVEQNTNTKIEKKKEIKKIISDLFCSHKKVVRKNGFIICTKCGYKRKVNYSTGTSK